ncbi:ABC transporter permease [Anaerosporobacter sp.]
MKAYIAFTKKEWMESIRTYKLFILLTVFFILGIMNPITAKITPDLLASLAQEGITISIAEPTAIDSWMQFYKNVPQMGLIVLVIMFSGGITAEYSKGTFINMITKGLKRSTIILSKFTMEVCLWTLSLLLCFATTAYYTAYFWNIDGIGHILQSVLCLWLFGIFLIAVLLLMGAAVKSNYACLLLTGGVVVVLFIINMIPKLQEYNPIRLASDNLSLITGDMAMGDFSFSIVLTLIGIILCLLGAIQVFNKKKI